MNESALRAAGPALRLAFGAAEDDARFAVTRRGADDGCCSSALGPADRRVWACFDDRLHPFYAERARAALGQAESRGEGRRWTVG